MLVRNTMVREILSKSSGSPASTPQSLRVTPRGQEGAGTIAAMALPTFPAAVGPDAAGSSEQHAPPCSCVGLGIFQVELV